MTPADTVAMAVVSLFGLVLGSGVLVVLMVVRLRRQEACVRSPEDAAWSDGPFPTLHPDAPIHALRPICWLAIKGRQPSAVQAALALTNPTPCSWSTLRSIATEDRSDGPVEDHQLFIVPRVNGWILVMGNGLPRPGDDVDVCFRFLVALSRKLGYVQFL